ncbi:tyrosine-type recombinase/integrase [Lelliottia wanjuensis]|uniref:Site-specific integrase n=1 Tax=Lelliottia wanjuensis TaxID=3050585 RepID=A0AAP4LDI7_9ENTR|nr:MULTISPECIES: site-specific integrase [unclassified Lelliottia]MDK9366433.1 site-specific integrase [Lelliottia sp. V106_12]MDK9618698.1 site-specific integrase [Lelliottia sp. V106_9]
MATIRKLPSGRWNAIIRKKGLPTKTKTFETREAAEAWAEYKDSCTQTPSRDTIALHTDTYLKEVMEVNGKKRGGHRTAKYLLNLLSRHFKKNVREITSVDVEAYRVLRLQTCKSGSVRLELQMLKRFMEWSELHGLTEFDKTREVFRFIKIPKASPNRKEIVSTQDFERLLSELQPIMQYICILAYETAMRRSEILQITPSMVSLNRRVILLSKEQTKNGYGRNVPLSTRAIEVLEALIENKDSESLLFSCKTNSVTQAFKRAITKLGLNKELCFHSLRHTCITRYAEKGLSTIQLQAISGHKTIHMLSKYCHVDGEDVVKLME